MKYRELSPSEYDLLKTFLFEAIFIPEGVKPPDRTIIESPELRLYYDNFGSGMADYSVVAEDECGVVGAAWVRIMDDYGHIDNETPSLAMSVQKANYAVRMYERAGFRTIQENGDEYIMVCDLLDESGGDDFDEDIHDPCLRFQK